MPMCTTMCREELNSHKQFSLAPRPETKGNSLCLQKSKRFTNELLALDVSSEAQRTRALSVKRLKKMNDMLTPPQKRKAKVSDYVLSTLDVSLH